MTYTKPALISLADARIAIQDSDTANQHKENPVATDGSFPSKTIGAYEADE